MDTSPQQLPDTYTESLELVERRQEDGEVSTYIFRPAKPVSFEAGQYAHIRLLSLPADTRRVHELSFASPPQEAELWFGVDARSGSPYQKALQALKPGDAVELFKIRGHMTWPAPVPDVVMIAAGVGVTPFRSMLLDARNRNLSLTTMLIQVASGNFLYAEDLKALTNEHVTIGRDLLEETLGKTARAHPSAHYYVAGSPDFVKTVVATLAEKGIERIESDEFKGLLSE